MKNEKTSMLYFGCVNFARRQRKAAMKKQQKRRLVRVFWLENVGFLDLRALGQGRRIVSLNHFADSAPDPGQRSGTAESCAASDKPLERSEA